jgi:hypothetical protein
MKQHYVKGIAGVALILAVALAACESPTSGSGGGGSSTVTRPPRSAEYESKDKATGDIYKLIIKENTDAARYAGRDGDFYELIVTFANVAKGVKTSTGTITKGGDKFILTAFDAPLVLLWIILDNTGLTKIHGQITFDNNGGTHDVPDLVLEPPPPPTPPGSHPGADSLSVSGGVWKEAGSGFDALFGSITYEQIAGTLAIDDGGLGGTGAITDGNLSYHIGVPTMGVLIDMLTPVMDNEYMQWNNLTVTPATAQGAQLQLTTSIDGDLYDLERSEQAGSVLMGGTVKGVRYIYVDQDVTIKGTGKTFTITYDFFVDSATNSTKSFNLKLKKGWNALYMEGKVQGLGVQGVTLSLKDPADVRWTVDEVKD